MKLVKAMYHCQDVPVLIFDKRCTAPCLYCNLFSQTVLRKNILATGEKNVLDKLSNFKGAYFSPTTDCFLPANAGLTHNLIAKAWSANPSFVPLVVTKQIIPEETIKLFVENKGRLVLQISVPSLDEELTSILEPGAAKTSDRLAMIKRLTDYGVKVIVVVMPWFNLEKDIYLLPQGLARVGVVRAIIDTGLLQEKQRNLMLRRGNELIKQAALKLTFIKGTKKIGYTMSRDMRNKLLAKSIIAFNKSGIKLSICTADNPDLEESLPLCTKFKHHNFYRKE